MMMTTEELQERLDKIDISLVIRETNTFPHSKPLGIVYISAPFEDDHVIYNFTNQKYDEENCLKFIPTKIHDLNKLLDEYYEGRNEIPARDNEDSVDSTDTETKLKRYTAKELGETARKIAKNWKKFDTRIAGSLSKENPFKEYTDRLAQTLFEKNQAYGDSFAKSIDKYGLSVIGVRLSDKYNRIEHLITNHELKENDESLEDTLLDMAGYSILALKYLEEHRDEN